MAESFIFLIKINVSSIFLDIIEVTNDTHGTKLKLLKYFYIYKNIKIIQNMKIKKINIMEK
jgi:hypothetical protein